jgi:SAM-dependent methyltransferase
LFEFSNGAVNLVSAYVVLARKKMRQIFNEDNRQCLELFLSDFKGDIRFYAIQISMARKALVVEQRDVREAARRLLWVFIRPKVSRRLYKKTLANMQIIEERLKPTRSFWVLDAGSGWGKASQRIGRYLDKGIEAVGIDIDGSSLKYGKSVNRDFCFVRSSMNFLPFKGGVFKVVISERSLHEAGDANDKEKAIREFNRTLEREGVLCILDNFELCYIAKLVRSLLRRALPKIEPYLECNVLESKLFRMNLRLILKERVAWSPLNLSMLWYYVAIKK